MSTAPSQGLYAAARNLVKTPHLCDFHAQDPISILFIIVTHLSPESDDLTRPFLLNTRGDFDNPSFLKAIADLHIGCLV
jgi:hypothetical protein